MYIYIYVWVTCIHLGISGSWIQLVSQPVKFGATGGASPSRVQWAWRLDNVHEDMKHPDGPDTSWSWHENFETLKGPFDLCSTLPSLDALGFEQCTTSSLAPASVKKLRRNPFSKWLMLSFYWDGHLWEAGYIPLNHWSAKKRNRWPAKRLVLQGFKESRVCLIWWISLNLSSPSSQLL